MSISNCILYLPINLLVLFFLFFLENCSLVIFTKSENKCLLIHCVTGDACRPIPSNTSVWIQSIRNNETDLADTLASNNTWNTTKNTTGMCGLFFPPLLPFIISDVP